MTRAIVLVSGGLDSCVAAAWAARQSFECIPINFAYGQRHSREIIASEQVCEALGFTTPITFNLTQPFTMIGGSSLTSGQRSGNPSTEEVRRTPSDLPPSFVPGRNIIMLSIAAGLAYTEQATHIVGGWNAVDYSGYPDCRPEFFQQMELALRIGLGHFSSDDLTIDTPLVGLKKDEIVTLGATWKAPIDLTWSCYAGGSQPCGECDSCKIRIAGFAAAGVIDHAAAMA